VSGPIVVIKSSGKAADSIELLAGVESTVRLDCSALLQLHELLVRVTGADALPHGLQACARPLRGARELSLRLWGGKLPAGKPRADCAVRLNAVTTQGVVSIELAVRLRAGGG
jgi:hypothetical protein